MPETVDGARRRRREILALALPALGTLAAEPLLGLVDTALVGHLGPVSLAALGAGTAILNLVFAILIFLEYGTTARLARHAGAGRERRVVEDAVQMSWIAAGVGVALTIALVGFTPAILRLVDVPPEARDAAATYLGVRGLAAVPSLGLRVANGIFRGLGDTRTPLYVVVGMNALNAFLDVVLIHGWRVAGIPALGISGAAWASVAATTLGTATFAVLLVRRLGGRGAGRLGLRAVRPRPAVLRSLLSISVNLLLRTIALMAALFTATRMAAGLGTASLAAHHVAFQLWTFLALVLDSLAIAGQILVGRALGAGRPAEARAIGASALRAGVFLGVLFAAGLLLSRSALPRVFSSDAAVLSAVNGIFVLLALMQVPNGLLFALDGILIGAGDFVFLRNALLWLGLLGIGAITFGARVIGTLEGVWTGIAFFILARLVAMAIRWRSGAWAQSRGDPTRA